MLPLDHAQNIWFIRQYRHSVGETILELPAGTLHPGEDPAAGAALAFALNWPGQDDNREGWVFNGSVTPLPGTVGALIAQLDNPIPSARANSPSN